MNIKCNRRNFQTKTKLNFISKLFLDKSHFQPLKQQISPRVKVFIIVLKKIDCACEKNEKSGRDKKEKITCKKQKNKKASLFSRAKTLVLDA